MDIFCFLSLVVFINGGVIFVFHIGWVHPLLFLPLIALYYLTVFPSVFHLNNATGVTGLSKFPDSVI